ncbi:MAG: DegV family protein [Oscillospiraceae bacterium]|jgi:DegV family protein with EDD domain
MNKDYVIITDATSDMSLPFIAQYQIEVIPMPFIIGEQEYTHYADGREMSLAAFYTRLRSGEVAGTAQINVATYLASFEHTLQKGLDLIYVCFSSGLSGMIQSANVAIAELKERYPERTIYCVDSLCASVGQGMLVSLAALQKEAGLDIHQLYQWLELKKLHLCHWFTVDDLHFLHRGGRVSKASAVAGSVLQIKPILHVDDDGHLIMMEKARGRAKALETLIKHMKEDAVDLERQTIFIGHGDDAQRGEKLAKMIRDTVQVKGIEVLPIGPVIGAHSGPGTIALFYIGQKR